MELLTISMAAGETKQFRKAGATLEIIDSISAVSVSLYSLQGGQTNSIKGGLSGLYLDADFGAFDVYSAVAQTVVLLICDAGESGGSRRQPGIVSVTNRIGIGIKQAESWNGTLASYGSVNQVVLASPALNLNGMLVRGVLASAVAAAGGTADIALVAAPAAPGSLYPGSNGYTIARASAPAGATVSETRKDLNFQLPVGWGVWAVSSVGAVPTGIGVQLVYELL